jgi:hypothetical protein
MGVYPFICEYIHTSNNFLNIPFTQASSPYEMAQIDKKLDTMLHRILVRGKGDFLAGGDTQKLLEPFVPLHSYNEPYMNPGDNPLLTRGVPESQKELEHSTYMQKPFFLKPSKTPFFTRAGGNKSTVLANDLFEVIAEAEETGGAVHRNLGITICIYICLYFFINTNVVTPFYVHIYAFLYI